MSSGRCCACEGSWSLIAQQSAPIVYSLPTIAAVSLGIFLMLGQAVAVLLHDRTAAGQYQATWNANVHSGLCFYRLQVGHFLETKTMVAVTYHERRVAQAVFMAAMP